MWDIIVTSQRAIKAHAREAAREYEQIANLEGDVLKLKTGKMLRLERTFRVDIRILLRTQLRGCDIAKTLSAVEPVSASQVSRWRKIFGIEARNSGQYTNTGLKGRH